MLSLQNVAFSYSNRIILRDLSFRIGQGELWHIKGPNGSGKSTLVSLLNGFTEPSAGTVHLDWNESDAFHSPIYWIPPDANALDHEASAIDNLRMMLSLWQRSDLSPEELFKTLTLWGFSDRYVTSQLKVGHFSTGMKRRLSLARLSLSKSFLWLLDEPLMGLDESAIKMFKASIQEHLLAMGSVVLITHDERVLEGIRHQTLSLGQKL